MFYVKKDKDEDQIHIMEHDQLSFSSITEQAAGLKEDQKQNEPFVASQSPPYEDGSANHWAWATRPRTWGRQSLDCVHFYKKVKAKMMLF